MSAQHLRTMIVALFGAFVLALGSVTFFASESTAAPNTPSIMQVSDFPFDGLGSDDAPSGGGKLKKDDRSEKAEKLGGSVTSKIIDLFAGVIKCGLNIMTPSVKCSL
ncbi:hypothetical protein OH799_17570 [Nocardia sp. NBC_00881]|uniref:hypothetical protein n=1 Tax=Nocardia sp. NBC_00881 TaxID=2975995 RepID=UPI00386438B9|nr:hypothetical protein OH799_17570 [Nocardia sp. NBC_00881]